MQAVISLPPQRCLSVIVNSNFYLTLGSVGIVLLTFAVRGSAVHIEPALMGFFGTLLIYNLNKLTDREEDKINDPAKFEFGVRYAAKICYVSLPAVIVLLILNALHSLESLFVALVPFIVASAYSFLRLKKVFLLKDILVPIGWSSASLLALTYSGFELKHLLLPAFVFSRSLVITICYDAKDVRGDRIAGVKTIPVKFGLEFTKKIMHILNISLSLLIVVLAAISGFVHLIPIVCIIAIYASFYIQRLNSDNAKKVAELFAAGEYIAMGLLAVLIFVSRLLS